MQKERFKVPAPVPELMGAPQRELSEWIESAPNEFKVVLVTKHDSVDAWRGRLVNAGIPKDRISVETDESFNPRADMLMVVADMDNRAVLGHVKLDRGDSVSRVRVVAHDAYKKMAHGTRGSDTLHHQMIHDGMGPDKLTEVFTEEVMAVLDAGLPRTMDAPKE